MSWDSFVLIQMLAVAFAANGLQRFVTTDAVSEPFRRWLVRQGWITQGAIVERDRPGRVGHFWRWVWKLCTCPFCLGAWCCIILWVVADQESLRPIVAVLAARGLQVQLVKAD